MILGQLYIVVKLTKCTNIIEIIKNASSLALSPFICALIQIIRNQDYVDRIKMRVL